MILTCTALPFIAQPSTNYSGQFQIKKVELSDESSIVSTELECDIQPGALRERYSVQWKIIQLNGPSHISNDDSFTLTLSIDSRVNGSQYQCEVTIDHNGEGVNMTYEGRIAIIVTTGTVWYNTTIYAHFLLHIISLVTVKTSNEDNVRSIILWIIIPVIIACTCIIFIILPLTTLRGCCDHGKRNRRHRHYKETNKRLMKTKSHPVASPRGMYLFCTYLIVSRKHYWLERYKHVRGYTCIKIEYLRYKVDVYLLACLDLCFQ